MIVENNLEGPRIRSNLLKVLPEYLSDQKVDARSVFHLAGFSLEQVRGEQQELPFEAVAELLRFAAREKHDPHLGLNYAQWISAGQLGTLDHLILSAATVREALLRVAEYAEVMIYPFAVKFMSTGQRIRLVGRMPLSLNVDTGQLVDLVLSSIIHRLRLALGPDWCPILVRLPRTIPGNKAPYVRVFGANLSFTSAEFEIVAQGSDIATAMPGSWPGIGDTVVLAADKILEESQAQRDFLGRVRQMITEQLADEAGASLDNVARRMRLSPRALQWRLKQRQTSLESVVLDVRCGTAQKLLRDTSMPMHEISRRLGFSESSTFTRWSKQHLKYSPKAYRAILQASED